MDFLSIIQAILTFIVYWIVIPVILGGLFYVGISIVKNIAQDENKISAQAGFWAGLILFIVYFIYLIPLFKPPNFSKITTLEINIVGVIIGCILGIVFLFIIKYSLPKRIVGFVVMFLTMSSSAALYSYIFIQTFNKFMVSSTLGFAFGSLLHMIIWPNSIYSILKNK